MALLYALKDVKLGKFYPPTMYNNEDDARRSIKDLLQYAPESMLSRHPEDFQLYQIAFFDEVTAKITNPEPCYVLTCNDLVKPKLEVVSNA